MIKIDNGRAFDFGKTSNDYAKYRDIYPKELFEKLYGLGVGKKDSDWLDLGTGTGVLPRGLASYGANITAVDISNEQIEKAKMLSEGFNNIEYLAVSAEDMSFRENSFDVISACQCFWYFNPEIIVPKIKSMLRSGGMFIKIYMAWLKDDPIAKNSKDIVKKLNPDWSGASDAVKDLTTHYFDDPQMDSFIIDLPFTRETWHGRMKTCRGVLASMDEKTFSKFEKEHKRFMNELPEHFTIKHKVFLTYYYL